MSALDKFMDSFEDLQENDKGQLKGGCDSDLTIEDGVTVDLVNAGSCSNYAVCLDDNFGKCSNYGFCW